MHYGLVRVYNTEALSQRGPYVKQVWTYKTNNNDDANDTLSFLLKANIQGSFGA